MKTLLFLIGIAVGWWGREVVARVSTTFWFIRDKENHEEEKT